MRHPACERAAGGVELALLAIGRSQGADDGAAGVEHERIQMGTRVRRHGVVRGDGLAAEDLVAQGVQGLAVPPERVHRASGLDLVAQECLAHAGDRGSQGVRRQAVDSPIVGPVAKRFQQGVGIRAGGRDAGAGEEDLERAIRSGIVVDPQVPATRQVACDRVFGDRAFDGQAAGVVEVADLGVEGREQGPLGAG